MVRHIGTTFDYTLNETIFVIQENERYVNATSITTNSDLTGAVGSYQTISVTVNDLLDKGYVRFYLNGELMEEKRTSGTCSFGFVVPEGESQLKFEFTGNDYCLKSYLNVTFVGENIPLQTPASISLTADNTVIQTGESATLSALVLDENDDPVPNVAVSFSCNITNTSLDNSLTDSRGIASYSYTGGGVGDVVFTASAGAFSDNCTVEDCLAYKLEEYSKTAPNTTEVDYPIGLEWNNTPYVCEFDINVDGNGSGFVLRCSDDTGVNIGISSSNSSRQVWGNYCRGQFSQAWNYNTWYTMKVVMTHSKFQYYIGDTLVRECTDFTDWNGTWNFAVRGWVRNRVVKVRNIKVKPMV